VDTRLLYWGFSDYLSIAIIALYALGLFFAYSLIRITRGGPAAWYVIILALALLLMRRTVELYNGLQVQDSLSDTEETVLSFFVALFLCAGFFMLTRAFRRQLRVDQESQMQP
jgi:hypothetical protein